MYVGVGFMIGATVFTVVEGIAWAGGFNVLEHVCYALAGVSFAVACWRLVRTEVADRGSRP
jgi:hypothetical protein